MDTKESRNKIDKAKTALVLDHPFFATLIMQLQFVEDPACPTAWTDGISLGYNPNWIIKLDQPYIISVLAHEGLHCGLGHMARRGDRHPFKWNIAADYPINWILREAGMYMPEGCLMDETMGKNSAEENYNLLPPEIKIEISSMDGDGENQDRQNQQDNSSGKKYAKGMLGVVRDYPGRGQQGQDSKDSNGARVPVSQAEMQRIAQDWTRKMVEAAHAAKVIGKLPGNIKELIDTILQSKVDWLNLLNEFADKAATNDYSWRMPNRRYINQNLYLPIIDGTEVGICVWATDCSGSIYREELAQAAGEINDILEKFPNLILKEIQFDTQIQNEIREYTHADLPIYLEAHGRGGTDFRCVFEEIETWLEPPKFLVVFTDMECDSYPKVYPEYPVMWVNTSKQLSYGPPPFGEVISIHTEKR